MKTLLLIPTLALHLFALGSGTTGGNPSLTAPAKLAILQNQSIVITVTAEDCEGVALPVTFTVDKPHVVAIQPLGGNAFKLSSLGPIDVARINWEATDGISTVSTTSSVVIL